MTWNAKCPIFLSNFTPKPSNYCLQNRALRFPGISKKTLQDPGFPGFQIPNLSCSSGCSGSWKHLRFLREKTRVAPLKTNILLMDKILHHQGWWLSHYLKGFNHPRWCRILSINSITLKRDMFQCEILSSNHLGVSKNKDTPKWMVKIMENPIF